MKQTILLEDRSNPKRPPVAVTLTADEPGIGLKFEGYGTAAMPEGGGELVIVELFAGRMQMKVWADIKREQHTHLVEFDYAKEGRR
jgi:hypothetical protein